jgi:hypothetical protein
MTRHPGQDSWGRTSRTGQPRQYSQDKTIGSGKMEKYIWIGQLGQDRKDITVTTGLL